MKFIITCAFWTDGYENSTRERNIKFTWNKMKDLHKFLIENNIDCDVKLYDFSPERIIEDSIHIPYDLYVFRKSKKINLILSENSDYDFVIMFDADCFFNESDFIKLKNILDNIKHGDMICFDCAKLDNQDISNVLESGVVDIENTDWHFAYSGKKENGPLAFGLKGNFGGVYISDIKLILNSGGFNENIIGWGEEDGDIISRIYGSKNKYQHISVRDFYPFHLPHYEDRSNKFYYTRYEKNKIIVHTPQNEKSRNHRYYNEFWFKFIDFLKTKFEVYEDVFFADANKLRYDFKLSDDHTDASILECEMIIENLETKEFVILSASDSLTSSILNHKNNPKCKKIIYSQFNEQELKNHLNNKESISKYSPWIYFPSNIYDFDQLYNERNKIVDFIDKFCFWGTSMEYRQILSHFNPTYFEGGRPIGDFYTYSRHLIKYKIGLSVSGVAEFCYRDIENFAMGVPIMRFEYLNKMYDPLIPNYHYISVDRPEDLKLDRTGNFHHAKLLEDRFLKIKDDVDFLNFISKNARDYYEKNLTMDNGIKLTYNILKLNEWE